MKDKQAGSTRGNVDDELAQALADTEGHDPPAGNDPVRATPPRPKAKGSIGLLVCLLVMVGGVVCLFLFSAPSASAYAMKVDDLTSAGGKYLGKKVRVEGELVPGTLVKRDKPCEYRFTIHGPSSKLDVRYPQCIVPDTFRDVPQGGVEVTVEGKLASAGEFEATQVMAKCSSKYDKDNHKMKDGPPAEGPVSGLELPNEVR